jgi:PAS domain S-box-containing protein
MLRNLKELSLSVMDQFHQAIILFSDDHSPVYMNQAALKISPAPLAFKFLELTRHDGVARTHSIELGLSFYQAWISRITVQDEFMVMVSLEKVPEKTPEPQSEQINELKLEVINNKRALKIASLAYADSESRLNTVFNESPISVQIVSRDGKIIFVNEAWSELWGLTPDMAVKVKEVYNIFEDQYVVRNKIDVLLKKAFEGEVVPVPSLLYDPAEQGLPGRPRWIDISFHPVRKSSESIDEVICLQTDVTLRQEALSQQKNEEEGRRFLNNITEKLLSTLEYDDIFSQVADCVVPYFSDGCEVYLAEGDELKRVHVKHKDPEIAQAITQLPAFQIIAPETQCPTVKTYLTRIPQFAQGMDQNFWRSVSQDDEEYSLRLKIGMKSYLILPLLVRGNVLGSLALTNTSDRPVFTEKMLGIAKELSERISMALDNSRLYKEAKNAVGLRDDFISIASHELKTPITSLKLQLDVVKAALGGVTIEPKDSEALKKVSRNLTSQIDRMALLVNDMLDISRVSVGKLSMRMEKTNISELIELVVGRFANLMRADGIEFDSKIEPNLTIVCDAFRIEQVISNLLSNAIKYGEKKPVQVILKSSPSTVSIQFIDHGRGIDPKDQERIFKRFERAQNVYEGEGLGLGLFISQEIIKRHKGLINVTSALYKGSTFTVALDRAFNGQD